MYLFMKHHEMEQRYKKRKKIYKEIQEIFVDVELRMCWKVHKVTTEEKSKEENCTR